MINSDLNIIGNNKISIKIPYNIEIINQLRKLPKRKWNPQKKYWEVVIINNEIITNLEEIFGKNIIFYIMQCLLNIEKELKIRKYSKNTIKNYIFHNKEFLIYIKKDTQQIDNNDIKDYFLHIVNEKNAGATTINISINALKFYFGDILNKKFIYEIKRPKKDKLLPVVYNDDEITKVFKVTPNLKHKVILLSIFSAGLRVSDAAKLRIQDIDKVRKVINIKSAKGRKDRTTLLSDVFLIIYEKYIKEYKPKYWLFEGQYPNTHISIRTIQKIFETAKKKAGIIKKGGIHILRHTFSTNLLENGVDIRIIQELLGHADIKTTMIYTHVSRTNILKVKSPLDNLKIDDV